MIEYYLVIGNERERLGWHESSRRDEVPTMRMMFVHAAKGIGKIEVLLDGKPI